MDCESMASNPRITGNTGSSFNSIVIANGSGDRHQTISSKSMIQDSSPSKESTLQEKNMERPTQSGRLHTQVGPGISRSGENPPGWADKPPSERLALNPHSRFADLEDIYKWWPVTLCKNFRSYVKMMINTIITVENSNIGYMNELRAMGSTMDNIRELRVANTETLAYLQIRLGESIQRNGEIEQQIVKKDEEVMEMKQMITAKERLLQRKDADLLQSQKHSREHKRELKIEIKKLTEKNQLAVDENSRLKARLEEMEGKCSEISAITKNGDLPTPPSVEADLVTEPESNATIETVCGELRTFVKKATGEDDAASRELKEKFNTVTELQTKIKSLNLQAGRELAIKDCEIQELKRQIASLQPPNLDTLAKKDLEVKELQAKINQLTAANLQAKISHEANVRTCEEVSAEKSGNFQERNEGLLKENQNLNDSVAILREELKLKNKNVGNLTLDINRMGREKKEAEAKKTLKPKGRRGTVSKQDGESSKPECSNSAVAGDDKSVVSTDSQQQMNLEAFGSTWTTAKPTSAIKQSSL